MGRNHRDLVFVAVAAAGLVLSACDDAEQGRVLMYQKGDYMGAPDTALSEDTLRALRQRAAQQKGE